MKLPIVAIPLGFLMLMFGMLLGSEMTKVGIHEREAQITYLLKLTERCVRD